VRVILKWILKTLICEYGLDSSSSEYGLVTTVMNHGVS
jgi:hypothetical protein